MKYVTLQCLGNTKVLPLPLDLETVESFTRSCGIDPYPFLELEHLKYINGGFQTGFFRFDGGDLYYFN